MTEESAADIIKYLDIVDGNIPKEHLIEGTDVHLGVVTQGAIVGNTYAFDNGLRWARITEEHEESWTVECGLLEYETDSVEYISKYELASMIRQNEMVLQEDQETDILSESVNDGNKDYNEFVDAVDRYLLVNYMKESMNFDYPWKIAWAEDKIPSEAAEEAILLED